MCGDARLQLHEYGIKAKEQAVDEYKVLRDADIPPLHCFAQVAVELAAEGGIAEIEGVAIIGREYKASKVVQEIVEVCLFFLSFW